MEIRQEVCRKLAEAGVPYTLTEHPAVFTIEEMDRLGITLDGEVCKNLFLRDYKGKRHFLVVLRHDKRADLAALRRQLGSTPLSFASEERLARYLGLTKGAVSPLGVFNDRDHAVTVAFDRDLEGCGKVGVHPNENTATVWLSFGDLLRVVESCGNPVTFVDV